jgi:hypothetical protein
VRAARTPGAGPVDAPDRAAEHRLDDDTPPVVGVGDDLVPRRERERHDGLEPAARTAVDRGEVAAADAAQPRPHVDPTRAGEGRRVDVAQAQQTDPRAPPGVELGGEPRRGEPHRLAVDDDRLHGAPIRRRPSGVR